MTLADITNLAARYPTDSNANSVTLPNLSVYARQQISEIEGSVYDPVMCLILQGSKVTSIGDQRVDLQPGDALVVSHDLPVMSRITKASTRAPYIAVLLSLDLALVRSLADEIAEADLPEVQARSLSAWQADPSWLAPLARYFELSGNPMDAQILGPSYLREIHYRLMLCPIGGMLRRFVTYGSHASRIAQAIHMLRSAFRSQLSVPDLAQCAGMSLSSFHAHFKSVTGTTPLQYQKGLRLIEARTQLGTTDISVSQISYAVGYESPTQFSRDYSRKFGHPPSHGRHAAAQ